MDINRICFGCFKEKEPNEKCPYCGFDETAEQPYLALPLGAILNGRYILGKVLGVGGFGITYLGYDLTLEIKVAIKEYMPSALATRHADKYTLTLTGHAENEYKSGMERFLDEARILAKLQNTPNIVSVQNYFKENNTAYFVMEYVDGMSLKDYLKQKGGKIGFDDAMGILEPIMRALEQVHALGLLHRDISPDNIYITSSGQSRLLDFGAARFATGGTKSVSVILKHGYAPEEQYSSHGNQGPWTDVYAMGATLYRCITGVLPPDSIERIHADTLKKPSELGVILSENADNAIMKALSLKTAERFSSMGDFRCALLNGEINSAEVSKTVSQTDISSNNPKKSSRFLTYLKKNPAMMWILGGGLVAVIALIIILPLALSPVKEADDKPSPSQTAAPIESTQPTVAPIAPQPSENAPAASTEQDLGIYNATIAIPANYTQQENAYSYIDKDNSRLIALMDYTWRLDVPIYSLKDIENHHKEITDAIMQKMDLGGSYSIITAGADTINGVGAYQIYSTVKENDETVDFLIEAIDGKNDFGCYILIGCYPSGDSNAQEEVYGAISTFTSKGAIDISYDVVSNSSAGLKLICDKSLIKDSKSSEFKLPNGKTGAAFILYFSSDTEQYIEIEKGYPAGENAKECMDYLRGIWKKASGATLEKKGKQSAGGVVWNTQNISYNGKSVIIATADIDGEPFIVGMNTDKANSETAEALFADVISTVRPLS